MQLALLPPGFNLTVRNGDFFTHGEPLHGSPFILERETRGTYKLRTHHYEMTLNQIQTYSCRYTSAFEWRVPRSAFRDQHFPPSAHTLGPQSHTNCFLPAGVLQGFDLCRRLVAEFRLINCCCPTWSGCWKNFLSTGLGRKSACDDLLLE